jgi:hypothetical protein
MGEATNTATLQRSFEVTGSQVGFPKPARSYFRPSFGGDWTTVRVNFYVEISGLDFLCALEI